MKKNKIYSLCIFAFAFLALTSCEGEAKESVQDGDFNIELLFEKDGCKMYRFKDGGQNIYWSSCEGDVEYSYRQGNGKTSHTVYQQSLTSKIKTK